jgi:hypothetical protein
MKKIFMVVLALSMFAVPVRAFDEDFLLLENMETASQVIFLETASQVILETLKLLEPLDDMEP